MGGPGDLDKNPRHRTLLQLQNVSFNDWGFEQLIPVIQRASLVLSVDTATMHLAVGLGVKTLCLASAAYVGEIVPYHDTVAPRNGHFLYTPMKCEGCLGNCIYPTTNNMFLCVSKIDKRVVLETVVTLLSEEKTL